MPFTSNAELRTAIKSWAKRDDFTDALCDDFIRLCEAKAFRSLRVRKMEIINAAFTVSSELTALPTGFKELRSIKNMSAPSYPLKLGTPQSIDEFYDAALTGYPAQYIIEGEMLRVGPAPSAAFTFRIGYYAAPAPLSDAAPTNWLLEDAPDAYLFGALTEAHPYVGDDQRMPLWEAKYKQVIGELTGENARAKRSGSQSFQRVRFGP